MSGTRARSSVIWLIGGLVVIAALTGVSAALRSRSIEPATASRSASSYIPVVGSGLVVRNALPTIVDVDARLDDPFYEGRDVSSAAPQLGFSRRELGSGATAVAVGSVDVGARKGGEQWVVAVTGVDGALIGSFELEWTAFAAPCITNGEGRFATQDCAGREGWWLARAVPAVVGSGCARPAVREIGSLADRSGESQRVEVVATCEASEDGGGGGVGAVVTTFVVRVAPR